MGDLENVNTGISNQVTLGLKKPTSLFERILMQTRSMTLTDKKICNSPLEQTENEEVKIQHEEGTTVITENREVFSEETVYETVDLIMNKGISLSERMDKLKLLGNHCAEDESLFEHVMSESLLNFCGNLLSIYCDPHSKDNKELKILVPLLSLISNCNEYNSSFSLNSNFTYTLMRACAVCVTGLLSKTQELLKMTRKKKLAARKGRIRREDSIKILARGLGIPCLTNGFQASYFGGCQVESFRLLLFDTSDGVTDTDINQYLANMHVSHLPEQNFGSELKNDVSSNSSSCHMVSEDGEEEWTDVIVAHALPFGDIIGYMKADWEHCLSVINGDLVGFLRQKENKTDLDQKHISEIRIGSIVGFWTKDVRFKWKPLIMMQCLRGLVLGSASQSLVGGEGISWAIWAVDVGTLVFCNKVWPLRTNLISVAPLTSICFLGGEKAVKDKEENRFLLLALPLLAKLLANKPSAAMHMVSFGTGNYAVAHEGSSYMDNTVCDGGAFLKLIEYPHSATRIVFLNLVLMLTRNSMEILRYLQECRFYLALYSRLQICVHFCSAESADSIFWMELRLLLRILTAIADGSDVDITELPGWSDMQKVLIMLTEIENHPQVRYMAAKCFASLESHKMTTKSVNYFMDQGLSDEKRKIEVRKPCDNVAGPSSMTNKSNKSNSRKANAEFKSRETVLAEPDESEPILSVMDVGDSSDDDIESLLSVNAVFDAVKGVDYYTKGYKVNIISDETCELSFEKTPHQISENNLSKVMCAFLNNGIGGSVYFGINSKSMIEGIKLSRIERDNFRKGIDRMMTRCIFPEIRPACYDINYVPVLNPGEKSKALASHKIWIIEVHIKALPHIVYSLVSDHKSYIRRGTEIIEGLGMYMRQEAAEQNKKDIIKAIEEVRAQIPQTEDKLISYIQDYLKRTQSQDCITDVKFTSTFSP